MRKYFCRNQKLHLHFKINSAVSTEIFLNQWIDLGIHTEACMTRPETCGTAGGAFSLWLRLTDCPQSAGIITTIDDSEKTGFCLWCRYKEGIGEIG